MNLMYFDRAPCAVKAACTVLSGGKSGDNFKGLPIAIRREEPGHQAAHGRWRCGGHWYHADPSSVRFVLIQQAQLNRKVVKYWAVS